MIDKSYQIKVYEIDWSYKTTISPSQVMNDLTFSANINWWQWQLSVSLDIAFDNTTFDLTDVVEVYEIDASNKNWRLIYTWYVTQLQRQYSNKWEYVSLVCVWLYAMLANLYFYSSAYKFTLNQAPDQTIKDILDYFNTVYTWSRFSYSWGWISAYGSSINIEFDHTKCTDAISNTQKATTDFYFYIDKDGQAIYKTKTFSTVDHNFTIWKDVDDLKANENVENVVNKYMLAYGSGTSAWPYTDATSQATYWVREKYELISNIKDLASANNYWNKYIAQYKDHKREIVLTINNNYDIESIRPWQFVKVNNTDYSIDWLQIQKIQYSQDKVIVYLDNYSTLSQALSTN